MLKTFPKRRAFEHPAVPQLDRIKDVILVRKTADETVNNSATLQNDDELVLPVGPNQRWHIQFVILFNSGATPDIKFAVTTPTLAVSTQAQFIFVGNNAAGTFGIQQVTSGAIDVAGTGAVAMAIIEGVVVLDTTPGMVRLQWAQNTANVSDSKVLKDSVLLAEQLV